jgi:hypothetical protein
MTPKPLSQYPPSVKAIVDPTPFEKRPDLVIEAARAICIASEIETMLEILLVEILGAAAEPAAAMIAEIHSASTVRGLVVAAAGDCVGL